MKRFLQWIDSLAEISAGRVEDYGARYVAFGSFSTINYLIPMYMWSEWHANDVSVYSVRVIAIILSFMLTISDSWYESVKKYRPLFWHFSIMFCLPFLVTFMALFDGLTFYWIVNVNIAILLGIILLDFSSFVVIYLLGISLGVLMSYVLGHSPNPEIPNYLRYPYFYMMIFELGILLVFARDWHKKYDVKMQAMRVLAASMAHEIRTPLSTISLILQGFDVSDLPKKKLEKFTERRKTALSEVKYIFDTIDVTLMKLAFNPDKYPCSEKVMAGELVSQIIDEYPFFENGRKLVHLNIENDFEVKINRNLFTHVMFNLLQNALYQIKAAKRGEIFISVDSNRKWRFISLKDTATGIKAQNVGDIFKPFFSLKNEGTGIGLYFCKTALNSMNAAIFCRSVCGEYAEFIIRF